MELTSSQRKTVRGLAQRLDPCVQIGKSGLTDNAVKELNRALDHDEIIKVRFGGMEREERQSLSEAIAERTGATLCGLLGGTASYYRQNADPEKRVVKL